MIYTYIQSLFLTTFRDNLAFFFHISRGTVFFWDFVMPPVMQESVIRRGYVIAFFSDQDYQ
jgi:hypothetical protein